MVLLLVFALALIGVLLWLMAKLRANDRALTLLAQVTRDLHASQDPRTALCEAVRTLTGAPMATLLEPVDGELVVTTVAGIDLTTARRTACGTGFHSSCLHLPIEPAGLRRTVVSAIWPNHQPAPRRVILGMLDVLTVDAALALERADLLAQLAHQAQRDGLTGLPNRRAWDDLLGQEVHRAERSNRPFTLALLDLDRFKDFNDVRGHLAGDDLLRTAADTWKGLLRSGDTLARWGGEEFAVLFPDTDLARAEFTVARLLEATPACQSFSAGVGQYHPGDTPEVLVGAVDAAMYAAKSRGRNRIVLANRQPATS